MSELDAWDYELPLDRIAKFPADRRDNSRLLVLPLSGGEPQHQRFSSLPELLAPGDLLVGNNTKVMAARMKARRSTGGAVEIVVLRAMGAKALALARPARKLRHEEVLDLQGGGQVQVLRMASTETVELVFEEPVEDVMGRQGRMPLPPYIDRATEPVDQERYQTVYAQSLGAAAAPTAGLHFTADVFEALSARGVQFATLTLHVGLGTFRPLRQENLRSGVLHEEQYCVESEVCEAIGETRRRGGRVIALGTTTARALESATPEGSTVPQPTRGSTQIFIRPPYTFRALDGLITNFHLPKSSLLMLVASLVGRDRLLATYQAAVDSSYRFYSYGDAMLLL